MLIGLTGQIGAGKSTAATILASFGAVIIDADKIGREVVDKSPVLFRCLVEEFGLKILTKSGSLSRAKLAKVAFADAASTEKLNGHVHPHLLKELRKQARELQKRHDIVVIDAALLLNWDVGLKLDCVIVINATRELRLKRLVKRGMSLSDAKARQRSQLPLSEFRKRANIVVPNNGTKAELEQRLRKVWAVLDR